MPWINDSPAALLERLRVEAVTVQVEWRGTSNARMKHQYGKYSQAKMHRLWQRWRERPQQAPPDVQLQLPEYERDWTYFARENARLWAEAEAEQLPMVPAGFYWADDTGGVVFPGQRTYRLWHNDLGYMPHAE